MNFETNLVTIFLMAAAMALFALGVYSWSRRDQQAGRTLAWMLFAGAWWAFCDALQWSMADLAAQQFWLRVKYLGIVAVPVYWFAFAAYYTETWRPESLRARLALGLIPVLTVAMVFTNDLHHWMWKSVVPVQALGLRGLVTARSTWFTIHSLYSYILVLSGVGLILRAILRQPQRYRRAAPGLLVGVLTPLIVNMLVIGGVVDVGAIDPTPFAFVVTGLGFSWSLFSNRLLEVISIAHEAVVRSINDGVIVLDAHGSIVDVNPAAEMLLNDSARSLVGKPASALERRLPGLGNPADQAAYQERDLAVEHAGRQTFLGLRVHPVHGPEGQLVGRVLHLSDISRRKQAEANLEHTQASYYHILDNLEDPFFEADTEGRLTYVNKAFLQAIGYERKEVIGQTFRRFTAPDSIRRVMEQFRDMYATGQPVKPFQYNYRGRDGGIGYGELSATPIRFLERITGSRGVIRDMTERIVTEQELRRAREAAEARASELSAINRVADAVASTLDLENMLQTVCKEMASIFDVRNAGIGLLDNDRKALRIVAFTSNQEGEADATGLELPLEGNASTEQVIRTRRPVIVSNAQSARETEAIHDLMKERGTTGILIVPLLARGQVIGTIGMPARRPDQVFSETEVALAATIASQIASAIENARLYGSTEKALGAVERDLEIGRNIQSGFFPEDLPAVDGWEIAARFRAARQVAGDFYDSFRLGDSNLVAVLIADVCDKGVGAALFMVLFRSLVRAFAEYHSAVKSPAERLLKIITSTNNYIATTHGRSNMFATMFIGLLDDRKNTIHYVNAGHEAPLLLDADGQLKQRLEPTGPAAGLFPDLAFEVKKVTLKPGDMLLAFTDGVTDARDPAGEFFSENRVLAVARQVWPSAFSLMTDLEYRLLAHSGERSQYDDITMIALRRNLQEQAETHEFERPALLENLPALRGFVEQAANRMRLPDETCFAFKLAVDEACANVIEHGYAGQEGGPVRLRLERQAGAARLTIVDWGQPFAPKDAPRPDLQAGWEERPIGGLGLYLIEELMDSVRYISHPQEGNRLILEKAIASNPGREEQDNGNIR
ncbi:MAG: SpoIIE family protein phosphatase [Chloroflexi bacterium]|nr:SpoIIE family protein phosphatase [Chloroflexota bacterium]